MRRNRRQRIPRTDRVYRSNSDRILGGVCGGLSQHFGINSFWMRIGFVVGIFLSSGLPVVLYLVCMFIMPREGYVPPLPNEPRRPRFNTQREALDELHRQFDTIEEKVRGMEDYVTSKEYVLRRKFENL